MNQELVNGAKRVGAALVILMSVVAASGCDDDPQPATGGGGSGSGTGGEGVGADDSGGGGTGAAPPMVCAPGTQQPCYTGPEGSEGVGVCSGGEQTCLPDGSSFGPCSGQVLPTASNCATPDVDEACNGEPGPCTNPPICGELYGDADLQMGLALATDASGNIFLAGLSEGMIDFGAGPLEPGMFVVALDPSCAVIWQRVIVGGFTRSIAVDSGGNVVLFGRFDGVIDFGGGPLTSSDDALFLAKLDASGDHVFSKAFVTGHVDDFWDWSVDVGPSDEIAITGRFEGSLDLGGGALVGAGDDDVFVGKLDAAGNHLWSKRFGDDAEQVGTTVAFDAQGNLLVVGYFEGMIDLGGGPLAASDWDLFVVELDLAGNHVWSTSRGGSGTQVATGAAVDSLGNVLLTGAAFDGVDLGGGLETAEPASLVCFAGKLSPTGAHQWTFAFGCELNEFVPLGPRVVVGANDEAIVTASFDGTADFGDGPIASLGNDGIAFALDMAGAPLWERAIASQSYDQGLEVALDPAGNVLLTGHVSGAVDLGAGLLVSGGSYDAFLLKFAP